MKPSSLLLVLFNWEDGSAPQKNQYQQKLKNLFVETAIYVSRFFGNVSFM